MIDGLTSKWVFCLGCSITSNVLHAELVLEHPDSPLSPGDAFSLWDAEKGADGPRIDTRWPEGMSKATKDVEFEIIGSKDLLWRLNPGSLTKD
jgi:hypothetical protein